MKKWWLLYITLLTSVLSPLNAWADLVMGVFPRRPTSATVKFFTPLAKTLGAGIGEPVKLQVYKNFPSFWKAVEAGKIDIVHYNQYHYLLSKKFGYEVIVVNSEFGTDKISGTLYIRKDSGISSVEDLKGKTILFGGGKKAMASYIAPTAILKKHGLKAGDDYIVKFAKDPPSAVIGVFNKSTDAAGAGNVILKTGIMQKTIDINDVVMLENSDIFIHLPWAVKNTIPAATRDKIKQIMLTLTDSDKGKTVLDAAKVDKFSPANDSDFDKVREIVKYALGETL